MITKNHICQLQSLNVIIGSIESTSQRCVKDVRAQAIGHFIFEQEKIGNMF